MSASSGHVEEPAEWRPVRVDPCAMTQRAWWVCTTILVPGGECSAGLLAWTRMKRCGTDHRTLEAAEKHAATLNRKAHR